MKKAVLVLSILAICLVLGPAAGAAGMFGWDIPWAGEIPQMEPTPWETGQYITYNVEVTAEGETVKGDLRFALVGDENIDGEDYYWFEIDVFNVTDLPEDLMLDEDFESVRIKILSKEYDFTQAKDDPEAFMQDVFGMEFIKRVIFQLNEDTPYEIDMSFLQMFAPMIEMSMEEGMAGLDEEDVQAAIEDVDWGYDEQTVTTAAGVFADAMHVWVSTGDDSGSVNMNFYTHEDVPLAMIVKVAGEIEDTVSGDNVDVDVELIEYGDDAGTWIVGEPEMFSFDMMGGMGPGMMGEM